MLTYRVTVFQPEKPEEVMRERKNHDEIIWSRTQNVYHDGRHSPIFFLYYHVHNIPLVEYERKRIAIRLLSLV